MGIRTRKLNGHSFTKIVMVEDEYGSEIELEVHCLAYSGTKGGYDMPDDPDEIRIQRIMYNDKLFTPNNEQNKEINRQINNVDFNDIIFDLECNIAEQLNELNF